LHELRAVPGFGDVWYTSESITDIFSVAKMEDKYVTTCEKAFLVHTLDQEAGIERNRNGLNYFKEPNDNAFRMCCQVGF
jgi:hypothetical protein